MRTWYTSTLYHVAVMLEGIYIPDVLISLFYLVQQARHLEKLGWQTTHRASWQVLYMHYYMPIAYWSAPWLESSTLQLQLQQDSLPQTYRVSEILSSMLSCDTSPPTGRVCGMQGPSNRPGGRGAQRGECCLPGPPGHRHSEWRISSYYGKICIGYKHRYYNMHVLH